MSNYRNYVEDFPRRCQDILEVAGSVAKEQRLEVTLLLMATSTALTVPYERLKPENRYIQPIEDRTRYENAAAQLHQLLREPFLRSSLWNRASASSWACDKLESVEGSPDGWAELRDPSAMTESQSVDEVLTAIRNGLAHGNLYMRSGMRREIQHIVFVTGLADRKTGKLINPFRFVQVSPADFRVFLDNWFRFLGTLDIPGGIVAETLDAA